MDNSQPISSKTQAQSWRVSSVYTELIDIFEAILSQRCHSPQKIYSIHEPEVQCISQGKKHKTYEFGNKVSIIRSATGIILGAWSFRNEYDEHTIEASLAQVESLTQRKVKMLVGDRGYRAKKELNGTQILIPNIPKASESRYQKRKKHKLFCKRAGTEPTIGHLKSDHRLGRNFYKGLVGDAINILLAAAAYNFKRAMKALLNLLKIGWITSRLSILFKRQLSKDNKINPLIGNAGVSAIPDSARISQIVGQEYDRSNHLLMHAMGPNVAGVIGSAIAAGFFWVS